MSSTPQQEPTMEEILASIRKIISEDASQDGTEIVTSSATATVETDVLDLTREIALAPTPEPKTDNDLVFQTIEGAAVSNDPSPNTDSGIFSDHTRKAFDNTFASIPENNAPEPLAYRPAAPFAPADGATIESVFERAVRESFDPVLNRYLTNNAEAVIERMKPLIREWMDEYFPALLEGAVRAEVERVVKAHGAKR